MPTKLQEFDRARLRFRVGHAEMDLQRLFDLKADREDRVQRGHRLLEDHRDVAAADFAHLLVVEIEQRAAVEYDAAFRDFRGQARQQPHDRERGHRFAGAGLADDGDHFAAVDGEADALDGAHDAARGGELGVQVVDFQQAAQPPRLRVRSFTQVVASLDDTQPYPLAARCEAPRPVPAIPPRPEWGGV